tara:strand:- start:191 stop:841 length:651 start_codon:yes stop_codon:yes gene_type:complete
MLNFIFKLKHRLGSSTGKTLLWIFVRRDLTKIKGELGIDLAGGAMANKIFFLTNKYVCVDIDQKRLDVGKSKNLDAIIVNSKIQDFLRQKDQEKPDVLACFQSMGLEAHIQFREISEIVDLMYHYLKEGGSMIFNIGNHKKDLELKEKELSKMLKGKFESVNIHYYGALHKTHVNQKKYSPYLRFILAYSMYWISPLRTFFGLRKNKVYFYCRNKL